MIRLEDILDDARRYLRREMDEPERAAFEALLREHPQLQEELRFIQQMREGFEVLEAIPEPGRRRRRRWLLGVGVILLALGIAAFLRWCVLPPHPATPPRQSTQVNDSTTTPTELAPVVQPLGGDARHPDSDQGFGAAWDPVDSNAVLLTGIFTGAAQFGDIRLRSREADHMDMFLGRYLLNEGNFEWVWPMSGPGDWKLARALAVDGNGDIVVTGGFGQEIDFGAGPVKSTSRADADHGDFFLTKFDRRGQPYWTVHAGGNRIPNKETGNNLGLSVTVDQKTNDIIFCGAYIGTPTLAGQTLPPGGPNEDLFLARCAPAGTVEWVRAATCTYMIVPYSVATDAAGNIFVTGAFGHHNLGGTAFFGRDTLTSYGGRDIFLAKYSPRGDLLWVRQAGSPKSAQGNDYALSVVADSQGNAVIAGYFEETARFGPFAVTAKGVRDIFLAKYSPDGEVLWVRRAGGDDPLRSTGDMGRDLSLDRNGNIYLTGSFSGWADFGPFFLQSRGWEDAFAAKYSPDGRVLWVRQWGGDYAGRAGDAGLHIDTRPDGTSVVTGYFYGELNLGPQPIVSAGREDIFLVVFDAEGKVVFVKRALSVGI